MQGPFGGSRRGTPLPGGLSLRDAIQRGLEYNLGIVGLQTAVGQARGQRLTARAALLPNTMADLTQTVQQLNLAAMGFRFSLPIAGFSFPSVVGPFSYVDVRARVSQAVVDLSALNNYRAARENLASNELSAEDARSLVVQAVGGTYLQTVAAAGRVRSARAQLETATVLYRQNAERRAVGLVAQVDVDRSQVQALTQQQRVTALQNDFAKQKINLARMIGIPPTDAYELLDDVPFAAARPLSVDEALRQARESQADRKAAEAHVRAADHSLAAARAARLPSVSVNADYGAIGPTLPDARGTFSVIGTVRVPIWQGGRVEAGVLQAEATATQRRAELEDLDAQIEADVRMADLDLRAAASQVDVAEQNLRVARETLDLTRQRFDAGVSDNVEVVQAQESVANAALDQVNAVFAHNLAKLALSRAIGQSPERVSEVLTLR